MEAKMIPLGSAPATTWRVSGDLVDTTRPGPPPRPVPMVAQPLNVHAHAEEIFYILKGKAIAHCDGRTFTLEAGDSFLARRGQTHQIVNVGPGRLYALCTMIPDDQFAELIRTGVPTELDD